MSLHQLAFDTEELTRQGGLLEQLHELLPEQPVDPTVGSTQRHKVSGSPAPWHDEAAGVYTAIHAGARELEREVREHITGHPGEPRGGSDDNTRQALQAVVQLAHAADEDEQARATRLVASWCREARQVSDIDQQEQWVKMPRRPGQAPPACPYCGLMSLRWSRERGLVRCLTNPDCADADGNRPSARMEYGQYSGQGWLLFRDGLELTFAADIDDGQEWSA